MASRTLWSWGYNTNGQLGLGDLDHRSSPEQIGSLTNWRCYSSGETHTAATKTDGTIWAWCSNTYGQLGLSDAGGAHSSPEQIGSLTDWRFVTCGSYHTVAVKFDGTLWSWGRNAGGALGQGDTIHRSSPEQVGSLTDWGLVIGGWYSTAVLKTDGTLWTWGENTYGELGLGDSDDRSSPEQVGSLTDWSCIGGGNSGYHMAAIKTDGTLWIWGNNEFGQLGLEACGVDTSRSSPEQVGSSTDWSFFNGGDYSSLAIKTDGTLWTWGCNDYGELGLEDLVWRSSPVQVGSSTMWQSANMGEHFTIAVKGNGTVWAWGSNTYGRLGLGDVAHRSSPEQVGGLTDWSSIVACGQDYVTGLREYSSIQDNTMWGCGYNLYGQLGLEDRDYRSSPEQVGSLSDWSLIGLIGLGHYHNAAIKTDGSLWTWGYNNYGCLGLGDTVSRSSPEQIGSLTDWKSVSCKGYFTLATKTDGTLWSWGDNGWYQLGYTNDTDRSSPEQVGSLTDWKSVSCGYTHGMAVKTDGTLWGWGYNTPGCLGVGDAEPYYDSPTQVGSLTDWPMVICGSYHTMVIKDNGTLWSWGSNTLGELGLGDEVDRSSPEQVGSDTDWSYIRGCYYNSAAIKTDGTLWTWGGNEHGGLGHGDVAHRSSPTQVGSSTNWKSVDLGRYHTTATKTDGTLWSWGYNYYGSLGQEDDAHRSSPEQVGSLTDWNFVACGYQHSVFFKYLSGTICWGQESIVEEDYYRPFADRWSGIGHISGSGDAEILELELGEYAESTEWYLGASKKYVLGFNKYRGNILDETIKYKTATTKDGLSSVGWTVYDGSSFINLGWVKVRIEI